MATRQVPARRHVDLAAPAFRIHPMAAEQRKLDPDAGESNPLPSSLGAGGDVVVTPHFPTLHPRAVVGDRERAARRVTRDVDAARSRVERVRHDLGENCLFQGTRVGIAEVLEQVQQIDPGLAHRWPSPGSSGAFARDGNVADFADGEGNHR